MLKSKTFEENVQVMNELKPTKLKHKYDLANPVDTDDTRLYSNTSISSNINADTKKTTLKYKQKIGYTLHREMVELQQRRGQTVLMISNAGSGKTYTHLKVSSELDIASDSSNVVYVFTVPGAKQSNQNQIGDDLWEFGFESVVGKNNKLKTDDGVHFTKKLKKGHRKFSCVYDLTANVVEEAKKLDLEVVLIVDEAHKLVSKFRAEAIAGIEKAMKIADMNIMMTATADKCEVHYKYDEIITLEDEDAQYNIKDLEIVYSDNWQKTIRREISRNLADGLRPLVNLSVSLKEISALEEALTADGYVVEVASSKNPDSKVFESIVETGIIPEGVDVVLATSTIEAGISIKSQDIAPIMVVDDPFKFSSDNTVQFFARPRKQVERAILIVTNKYEDINKALADMKTGKNDEYKKVHNMEYYMNWVNAEVIGNIAVMNDSLKRYITEYGVRAAVDEVKDNMYRMFGGAANLVVFDEYKMEFFIDKIAVIEKATQRRDAALVCGGMLDLQTHFINKIFYEKLTMRYDDLKNITKDEKKALDESIKKAREIKKAYKDAEKAEEDTYRSWFKDKEFLRLLPELVANRLDVMRIKEYDTDIEFRDLVKFKQSSLYNVIIKSSIHLTIDEIAVMVTSRYNESGEYISLSDMQRICDVSSNVKHNKIGSDDTDKGVYNVLTKIIDDLKAKGGKKSPERIALSKKLTIMLYAELVRTRQSGYTSVKVKKELKDAPPRKKFNYKNYYTDKKISALEEALIGKDGKLKPSMVSKLTREIERIYNTYTCVVKGNEYVYIDNKLTKFDFDKHLNDALSYK